MWKKNMTLKNAHYKIMVYDKYYMMELGGSLKTSLKEKLLPTFQLDALVVFRAKDD